MLLAAPSGAGARHVIHMLKVFPCAAATPHRSSGAFEVTLTVYGHERRNESAMRADATYKML